MFLDEFDRLLAVHHVLVQSQGDRISITEFSFQILWTAQAAESAVDHDRNSRAQDVTLLHAV